MLWQYCGYDSRQWSEGLFSPQYHHRIVADETKHFWKSLKKEKIPFRPSMGRLRRCRKIRFPVSLQFRAVIWFNKWRIKSSVSASERRPPSQANAVTTLASQSLNVCKYCNKQQGFPHKRCSSSTSTDRRYGPWLQDKERYLPLSSSLFRWFSKEIWNLRCRQGRTLLQVSVHTPNSPGFYSAYASFPLIPAWECLSDGLISCSDATFIMACSILCFHHVGSAVIPWPLWNMFAVNSRERNGKMCC